MPVPSECLSHCVADNGGDNSSYEAIKKRLSDAAALNLLEQLNSFDLGRFLIQHRGLNGFWTSSIVAKGDTPLLKRHISRSSRPPLEDWLLNECPAVVATQERFKHFQKVIQLALHPGSSLASVPCGVMDDLLTLDYSEAPNVKLTGIDIDGESLKLAEENAALHGLQDSAAFLKQDAWDFGEPDTYNLITSNGLNIYEPNEERNAALFRNFRRVLKSGGYLVTSFLTPPPSGDKPSPWREVKQEDLQKQKMIFSDILQVKWQVFRAEEEFRAMLRKAGFAICDIIYDRRHMFPTVLAQKP